MVTCEKNDDLRYRYDLSDIRNLVGLQVVKEAVLSETDLVPVDGDVVLGELNGFPRARIVYELPGLEEVLTRAEAIGSIATSREAELSLR